MRVHHKTITKFSEGKIKMVTKTRATPRTLTHSVHGIKVHIGVWKIALKLCKGQTRLLEVRSETEVVVHNQEGWRELREASHAV